MSASWRAHVALFVVNVIYGANYLIAKGLMPDKIGPSGFILLRVSGAITLFWGFLVAMKLWSKPGSDSSGRRTLVNVSDLPRFIFCGLSGVASNQLLFFNGLSLTSPINSAIIMTSNPIIVLGLSALILRERVSLKRFSGILVGAAGAITLILLSKGDIAGTSSATGDLLVLLNSASYALYLVGVKPLMSKYHPLVVVSWVFLFGLLFVIPFGAGQFMEVQWSGFSVNDTLSAVYVVVGTTFLAYLLNIFALRSLSPTVASSYIYLQPLMAGLFAWTFASMMRQDYSSDITWSKVGCAAMIFVGVYLVSSPVIRKAP